MAEVAVANDVDVALVTIPSLAPHRITAIAARAHSVGVMVRFLPSFVAALERDVRISDLRSVRIDTLLGRDEVHVIRSTSRSVIAGRRVLVTGAGGSIGSELCRQIDAFCPAALYMLDHDESNLHRLQLELRGHGLLDFGRHHHRGHPRPRTPAAAVQRAATGGRLPRGRAQAPAAAGTSSVRGRQVECRGHRQPHRVRDRDRCRARHPHLDRQGRRSQLGARGDQAACRDDHAQLRGRGHANRIGPIRQRARQPGLAAVGAGLADRTR